MPDIYLHSISADDFALFHQFVCRKLLFEQGIIPPRQVVSQHRNEILRAYIKSVADEERITTAGFHVEAAEQEGYQRLLTVLRNKEIETWALHVRLENKILLIVPRGSVQETAGSINKLVAEGVLLSGEQEY